MAGTIGKRNTAKGGREPSRTTARRTAGRTSSRRGPVHKRERKSDDRRLALALELQALRIAADDCVEHYLRRIRARLSGVVDRLESGGAAGGRVAGRLDKQIGAALDRLHALKLKPQKGRAKDLARIVVFLDELERLLPSDS